LLHLTDLDSAQHHDAPFSSQAFAKLEVIDQLVGRIFNACQKAGIAAQTTYVLASDHGFMSVSKQFNANFILMKKGFLTFTKEGVVKDWQAIAQGSGGSLTIMGNNLDQTKKEELIALFEAMAKQPNSAIYRVIKPAELAKLGANPQAICFLEAASGYTMSDKLLDQTISKPNNKGVHGYLPTRAEMYASLIMAGQGIRQGVNIPLTRNHNVAPTIAALLGFSLTQTEGRPLREFLTVAPAVTPKTREQAK
jgi:predicted AlkP superfamily pyrophosphatase or phosphodiesterase